MVERGLVRREQCESDQRGWYIAITDVGRSAIERAAPGHVAAVKRGFIDRLTPNQLRTLVKITDVVLSGLADVDAEA
jgi:DNA-binding MarR family transcriptional regulator